MVTFESLQSRNDKIGIVGLGYVGLPLAVHLARHFEVLGFDLKTDRVAELRSGFDRTLEVADADLAAVKINFTSEGEDLGRCRLIIVAVPTPIDEHNNPDLSPLRSASVIVGRHVLRAHSEGDLPTETGRLFD